MAAWKDSEDWDWFEIWQDDNDGVMTYRRMVDPHHRTSPFHSAAFLDANVLEKWVEDSQTAKDGKVARAPTPGAEALAKAGLSGDLNKHTYYVYYNK